MIEVEYRLIVCFIRHFFRGGACCIDFCMNHTTSRIVPESEEGVKFSICCSFLLRSTASISTLVRRTLSTIPQNPADQLTTPTERLSEPDCDAA